MKTVVRKIDRALKQLYRLDVQYKAENFLHPAKPKGEVRDAALLVKEGKDLSIGIYLGDKVEKGLSSLSLQPGAQWSWRELEAFSIAAEEVSHFLCFIYHALSKRPVSQLELEIQGEIDKFLLTYFARNPNTFNSQDFDALFEQFFFHFRLHVTLSVEQENRYLEANRQARAFIKKWSRLAGNGKDAMSWLRHFYRLGLSEKFALIAA